MTNQHGKMQIKTTMKYHSTFIRRKVLKIKKRKTASVGEDVTQLEAWHTASGNVRYDTATFEQRVTTSHTKSLLWEDTPKNWNHSLKVVYFLAALFLIAKIEKLYKKFPKCPMAAGWIKAVRFEQPLAWASCLELESVWAANTFSRGEIDTRT